MPAHFKTGLPASSGLSLQYCDNCQYVNYPARELCGECLADSLQWKEVSGSGSLLSSTELHYPLEDNFSGQLPWSIASVKLDEGPVAFAHLQPGLNTNETVTLSIVQDEFGNRVLVASDESQASKAWLDSINFSKVLS